MSGFDSARRSALVGDLIGVLLGRPVDLLPFEEVREKLRLRNLVDRGVREVPLDQIVGTVDRQKEFNREFLPRDESLRERWEEAEERAEGSAGYPPVELYQVGEAYFVVDGHHRISVAKAKGAAGVEARVKEFLTPVPVSPEVSIEDLVLKGCLATFLEATGLVPETPDEYRASVPNAYEKLLDHIGVHRWYRGIELGRPVAWEEAVASWRDTVYRPMVEIIRRSGVLDAFPGWTEADLYVFVMGHLHALRQAYGTRVVSPERAVKHLELSLKSRKKGTRRLGRRRR